MISTIGIFAWIFFLLLFVRAVLVCTARKVTVWRFQSLKKLKKEITYWTGSGVSGSDLQKK